MPPASPYPALTRPLRWALLGLALSAFHLSARADLWAYVDDQGITHFAASQVDPRYQLFYKGKELAELDLVAREAAAGRLAPPSQTRLGVKPGQGGEPQFQLPARFARLDGSSGYKSVQKHLRSAAATHRVDYELLKAVVAAESGFDADAVSPKGAVGLMQLMPTTAQQYGVVADRAGRTDRRGKPLPARSVEQKLTDPGTNIDAGARYLAYLIKLFKGELELAVAAYNAGEGAVQRAGNKIPNYKETQGYVKTVMGLYGAFKPEPSAAPAGRAAPAHAGTASLAGRAGGRVRMELPGNGRVAALPMRASRELGEAAEVGAPPSGGLTPVLFTPAQGRPEARAAGGRIDPAGDAALFGG